MAFGLEIRFERSEIFWEKAEMLKLKFLKVCSLQSVVCSLILMGFGARRTGMVEAFLYVFYVL
jgi:hypothetical protein